MNLSSPLIGLAGIGPRRAAELAKYGLRTLEDLLWNLPNSYEQLGEPQGPAEVGEEGRYRLRGSLVDLRSRRLRGRGSLIEGRLVDGAATLDVVWFHQRFLLDRLRQGTEIVLIGTVRRRGGRWQLSHPEIDDLGAGPEANGPRPRYGSVGSLSGKRVGALVTQALDRLSRGEPIEVVPKELLETFSVPVLTEALERVHRPAPGDDLDALNSRISPAHRRLALGELYEDQLELAAAYMRHRNRVKGRGYRLDDHLRQVARELLPFRLTMAQKRVVGEMVRDLTSPYPMLRLLQGDVGSGKTVVAALLMLVAAENGVQSTLLAPTQLLAEQHATTLRELFGERMPVLLLMAKGRGDEAHPTVSLQEAPVVVGTHALLSSTLELPRLGLVIIDEQHRFGVTQRQAMVEKGRAVDLLVMSATPIPRTLALAGYGDLDLSLLDEMPPGRRPVETLVVPRKQRKEVYSRLRQELRLGRQGYVVFPSIRPRETGKWASLEGMAPKIEAGLEGVSVERFHGQLAWEEREEIMRRFRSGDVQLLLATTVVEVGVDVPAATVMIIEGAERFGLAQLHQLRGRVGRGREESWCAAIHGTLTPEAELRLQAFAAHQDGFSIAEHDLKIRGQGELLGERQAGMMSFRVADLERDADLLEGARVAARRTVTKVFETLKWDRDEGGDQWFVS